MFWIQDDLRPAAVIAPKGGFPEIQFCEIGVAKKKTKDCVRQKTLHFRLP